MPTSRNLASNNMILLYSLWIARGASIRKSLANTSLR